MLSPYLIARRLVSSNWNNLDEEIESSAALIHGRDNRDFVLIWYKADTVKTSGLGSD